MKKVFLSLAMLFSPSFALAETNWWQPMSVINDGDTAWVMISAVLVLFMTIPGLALFYGGMVRKKNILSTMMHSFSVTALISVLWVMIGYSLAFTEGNAFIGGLDRLFLNGIGVDVVNQTTTIAPNASSIPETVFMFFQMTFAVISVALLAVCLQVFSLIMRYLAEKQLLFISFSFK